MGDIIRIHPERVKPDPLWREVLGRKLRAVREDRGARLVDVAARAGISPQYLSEIERGRKEPSSETSHGTRHMTSRMASIAGTEPPGE